MPAFVVSDPDYEARVRSSFARQTVMTTIGAEISRVAPGEVEIMLPYRTDLTQQHGFIHAGIITTIVDSACGYAALSLMPAGAGVLTVEYKVNFMFPASGESFIARGRVIKPGQTVTVCTGEVYAVSNGQEKVIAAILTTMMSIRNRGGLVD
jgi:uncharacterized protein (TIGR00369 family)